jgi:membrane-bound serine protease (ClpP class)
MREIVSEILRSPAPVIGYVAPSGAHAASAGTYILYATHVAAMAPGTNLGAATPVQIGGLPGLPSPEKEDPKPGAGSAPERNPEAPHDTDTPDEPEQPGKVAPGDPMSAKVTNDAVAFIRSLAQVHGRNAEWAEEAVREAASLSATDALEQGVIDVISGDIDPLLVAVDGRTVTIGGTERVLETAGLPVEQMEPDAITRILGVLSNPNVALVLMMIGLYGVILEFWNPGAIAPGVVGAISLTVGLYALNQLPLDYAGLALVGLGIAFMIAEALAPSFGVLGFGGIVAFVLGAAMLVDTDVPEYRVSWWVIGTMAAMSIAVLVLLLGFTLRAYRRPAVSGARTLVGASAHVLEWSGGQGFVWAAGERWRATGATELRSGDSVRVCAVDGIALVVSREPGESPAAGTAP